jgi:hypothetical protein
MATKKELPPEVLEFFKKQGSRGGKLGGSKAWANLTPEERSTRAKNAVAAREAKRAAAKDRPVKNAVAKKNAARKKKSGRKSA